MKLVVLLLEVLLLLEELLEVEGESIWRGIVIWYEEGRCAEMSRNSCTSQESWIFKRNAGA